MAKKDPNRVLIEKTLDDILSSILVSLGTNIAEWDYDKYLRNMLRNASKASGRVKKFLDAFDQTYELIFVAKTTIDKKYKEIYKIKDK